MPFEVSITVPNSIRTELKELQDGTRIQRPLQKGLYLLADRLSQYPSKRPRRIQFVSGRQRRGFFARLRSGQITVPYRRTGTLGRLWTSAKPEIKIGSRKFSGQIGNSTPYGQFVQDENFQAFYHQENWQTDIQIMEGSTDEIVRFFRQEFGG